MISDSVPLLKPCPFCGNDLNRQDFYHDTVYPVGTTPRLYSINCDEGSGGCGVQILGDNVQAVVRKWNTRQ